MKIRIKGNALRFRLTRSEVDQLFTNGKVADQVNFGNTALQYVLCSSNGNRLQASFDNNCIQVNMPVAWITEWINTDRVGFEGMMELDKGEKLSLLVEKDFICMDKALEDQSDHYPNPLLNKLA